MKRYLGATKIFFYFHLYPKLYETEIEIWAGFGSAGSTEKNMGPIMRAFFHVFTAKYFFNYKVL